VIDPAAWQARRHEWLPDATDHAYVQSLMEQVTEPGRYARWIAPPRIGINNQPLDFRYVRL
jgi:benzoyl-CoA 2,3-epoxidase subunit B